MSSNELRQRFFDFFRSKNHEIVPSASMVVKNDPTLMFTNAGMNQFKDIFLGVRPAKSKRVANSQKCLRVSGKHNDLEEVGHDTYHHTMFEMLGNWSFGDYFKKEAIAWGWEFLTTELNIPEDRLYATIFEGSPDENVPRDDEAASHWLKCFSWPENKIIEGSRKDNFWEMGETGPCGPCSEIHIDLRDDSERKKEPGHLLVNKGHPHVIEIWNLVFIQYNRKANGTLEPLPASHVDTGMGFERLCMVVQEKKSNYDTDIFQSIIAEISSITGKAYGENRQWDIAMRVIADHLRAVSFSIADGQLPSNNKAGYVIRRILRRAVRYGYTYLGMEVPFINKLIPVLLKTMGDQYPELKTGSEQITRVILEEETAFLRTLGKGIRMIDKMIAGLKAPGKDTLPGDVAFELYDTFGFPPDLTQLILREHNMKLDQEGFEKAMSGQKERSREDASVEAGDWIILLDNEGTVFTGYSKTEDRVKISRYRKVRSKNRDIIQLVFDKTPFYAEAGGQAGDSGSISTGSERIIINNTLKENNLVVHLADKLPSEPSAEFTAAIDTEKRQLTANNHTATHLLHHSLRAILGEHVEQKGSLVNSEKLRFDFSHFSKISKEEISRIETMVNKLVRKNTGSDISENVPFAKAREMGAMALFGEKYGDKVRVVRFGDSVELCGGTHVERTGSIGFFKIISETAIAAGIRRIEAVTAAGAEDYINERLEAVDEIALMLKSTGNVRENVEKLLAENNTLRKTVEKFQGMAAQAAASELLGKATMEGEIRVIAGIVEADSAETLRNIAYQLKKEGENVFIALGSEIAGKASLLVMLGESLINDKKLNAVTIIREISGKIEGGGGGQPFLATAGGKKPSGLSEAIAAATRIIRDNR